MGFGSSVGGRKSVVEGLGERGSGGYGVCGSWDSQLDSGLWFARFQKQPQGTLFRPPRGEEICMMSLVEKISALSQISKERLRQRKPRIRIHAGACVTESMIKVALGIETFAQKLARWAESKRESHSVGGLCPHCNGSGRYRFHTDASRNEKCYRCDGKGRLSAKDLAYLDRRLGGAGPICWMIGAPAA